jgi:SAM-dependent methyltransferase
MLLASAALTLSLAQASATAAFGLKDATTYNIMFEGPKPVFLDLLSFERRESLDPVCRPYAQFVRAFLYPLFVSSYFGIRLEEILLPHRDGLEPERMLRICPLWRLLLPPFLGTVTIPAILSRGENARASDRFRARKSRNSQEAKFLLDQLFGRAGRLLVKALDRAPKKHSSYYADSGNSYTARELAERIVTEAVERWPVKKVLDIGCSIGRFSVLAARCGASVMAIDHDPDVVGMLWKTARQDNLDILSLVIDIARPPGACGWENAEFPSYLDRARGKFDCVLMLALIHHLMVNERVPLDRIFKLVRELTTNIAIVEYVDRDDSQFQRIARGRDALHDRFTRESFESAARRYFKIIASFDVRQRGASIRFRQDRPEVRRLLICLAFAT